MTPKEVRDWLPVVRDVVLLLLGLILIVYGVVVRQTDSIISGFVLTGFAIAGVPIVAAIKRRNGNCKDTEDS